MKQEPNDKKHLTSRQIVNRYRKGVYVDENIEAISSAISSSNQVFGNVAIPLQTSLPEKVVQNIAIAKKLYERLKEGKAIDGIEIPDYPLLKDVLLDLSYPPLWEYLTKDSNDFVHIMGERGLICKYRLDVKTKYVSNAVDCACLLYKENIEQVGLPDSLFRIALLLMLTGSVKSENNL